MVPDLNYTSDKILLESLLDIVEKLTLISNEKREAIINHNYSYLYELSSEQDKISKLFESNLTSFNSSIKKSPTSDNGEIIKLKHSLKTNLIKYRENEGIVMKLLNDSLFFMRLKVEKLMPDEVKNKQYSKEKSNNGSLRKDVPISVDRFI